MRPQANPPRLMQDPEFGGALKSAAKRKWSRVRLEQNAEAIRAKIAGKAAAGVATATATAALEGSTVAKIGLLLLFGLTAGTAAILWSSDESTDERDRPATFDAAPEPESTMSAAEASVPTPAAAPQRPITEHEERRPIRPKARREEPTPSTLPAQLELFGRAQQAAQQGNYDHALSLLDSMRQEYPNSPIKAEISISRAEYLVAANRYENAIELIESILAEKGVTPKKAQLLQLAADAWMKKGNCDRAAVAYQKALGLGLGSDQAASARSALRKCKGQ